MSSDSRTSRYVGAVLAVAIVIAIIFGADFVGQRATESSARAERHVAASSLSNGSNRVAQEANEESSGTDRGRAAGSAAGNEAAVPVVDLMAVTGGQDLLDQLGIERDFAAWARARGFVWGFDPTASPYAVLTTQELNELAATGDKAAELALAIAMAGSDPAAALDRVQELAIGGHLEAMAQAGSLYGGIDNHLARPEQSTLSPRQVSELQTLSQQGVDLEIEGMAWGLLFDSYMGYPRSMGTPRTGDPFAQYQQACDRAIELRELVEARAAQEGRIMPAIEPAPFGIGSVGGDSLVLAACPDARLPAADFGGCQPIRVYLEGEYFEAYVCP